MMSAQIKYRYQDYLSHNLIKNVKKQFYFQPNSFKAVIYVKKIYQISYEVITDLAPKRYHLLALALTRYKSIA